MSNPPRKIDPSTLRKPDEMPSGPLPAGTPIYDSDGHLLATLGEPEPSEDGDFDYVARLIPPAPELSTEA